MNCKIGFLFILIMLSGEIFAQEKWYKPVDIGQHIYIDSSLVKEEKLSKAEANKIFGKDTISSKEFFVKMNALRDSWLKLYEERYKQKFYTAKYFNKEKDFRVTYQISKFSNSQAKIYVIFTYGHYMWHHYHVLLKEFLIDRSDTIDKALGIKELEKMYAYTFKGLGNGIPAREMIDKLGKHFVEYAGQSPQYRNIYYEKYNIEIIIQDEIIKYIKVGKPSWTGSSVMGEVKGH